MKLICKFILLVNLLGFPHFSGARLEEHSKNVLDQIPDESNDTATPNAKAKNEEAQEETAEAKEGSTNLRLQHSIHSRYQETNHYESSHIKNNAKV